MNDLSGVDTLYEPPEHGGDIQGFCKKHGFERNQVLDLSTGISPWSWSVPEVSQQVWQNLPCADSFGLLEKASAYYQCPVKNLLPVAGSQLAIEALPRVAKEALPRRAEPLSEVMIPGLGYAEHEFRWQKAGHKITRYSQLKDLASQLQNNHAKYAVVINPNNPGTDQYAPDDLFVLAQILGERGGFLIVDEAFIDAIPELSLAPFVQQHPLIVLRSVGKFFGLAGLRLGFVAASEHLIDRLDTEVGLWSVGSAAHWLGSHMLADADWIEQQRARIESESANLLKILEKQVPQINWKKSTTFVSGFANHDEISRLETGFAKSGIYVRVFNGVIRLGLVDELGLKRLKQSLQEIGQTNEI